MGPALREHRARWERQQDHILIERGQGCVAPVLWGWEGSPEDVASKGPYRDRVDTKMLLRRQFQGSCCMESRVVHARGETVMQAHFLGKSLSLASRGCAEPWKEREKRERESVCVCVNF